MLFVDDACLEVSQHRLSTMFAFVVEAWCSRVTACLLYLFTYDMNGAWLEAS
jgi:hypothetical protein